MAKSSKAKKLAKRREAVEKAARSGPTPETAAKLKPDPFNELVRRHILDGAQKRAGLEIRAVFLAVTSGVGCKSIEMGGVRGGSGEMSKEMADAHHERYLPWCERWGRSVADVIDLVVDAIVPSSLALAISTHGAEAQRETADDQSRALAAGIVGRMLADYARRQRNATGKRERAA